MSWPLNPPFVKYISAPPGSGKTTLLIQLMLSRDIYFQQFNKVYVICPNVFLDPKYSLLGLKDRRLFEEIDVEQLQYIVDNRNPEHQILFIFDDIMADQNFKTKEFQLFLDNISINHRHTNISMIMSNHAIKTVSPLFRGCVDGLIVFKPNTLDEIEKIYESNNIDLMKKADFVAMVKETTAEHYNFLYINKQSRQVFHNFNRIL